MGISSTGRPAAAGDADLVAVGRIGPAHGNQGAVFVEPWTDAPQERFAPGAVLLTDPAEVGPLTVRSHRFHGDRLLVEFVGFDDRTAVGALRATRLLIPSSSRPPLADPDEFYDSDLIGVAVLTPDGAALGRVRDVVHLAGAVYLAVATDDGEHLLPFVRAIVPVVDLAAGRIVADPPEGLFEL